MKVHKSIIKVVNLLWVLLKMPIMRSCCYWWGWFRTFELFPEEFLITPLVQNVNVVLMSWMTLLSSQGLPFSLLKVEKVVNQIHETWDKWCNRWSLLHGKSSFKLKKGDGCHLYRKRVIKYLGLPINSVIFLELMNYVAVFIQIC